MLSRILANILALYYEANIHYSHINSKGNWEFAVGEWDYYGTPMHIYYKTKGYKC